MNYIKLYGATGRYVVFSGGMRYLAVCDDHGNLIAVY